MIDADLLVYLRCPLDPSRTKLLADGAGLRCERCGLRFRIKDGLPNFLVEDAELPAGCAVLDDLPCKKEARMPSS
jgi:uncharacterized protein YbaR (Trm112 family)